MRKDKCFYRLETDEVLKHFHSSEVGLNDEYVKKNQKIYGENKLEEAKRKTKVLVFLEQFKNLLVVVLLFASILSYFTGGVENTIVILIVLTLNAFLGTIEYFKAEKSLLTLKKLSSLKAKVVRNNVQMAIDGEDVVCGDIVLIKSGDVVCCDGRIISSDNLEIDESLLTGESTTTEKDSSVQNAELVLAEQKNMVFRGTKVTNGKGKFVCTEVGMTTEIGKIAKMLQDVKQDKTPLEKNIDKFSRQLAFLIIVVCLCVFVLSLYRGITITDSLMFAISLAVAAIPEALQTIVTIVLAISTEKMAKEKAIIKNIKAIETLGNIDYICTDKTGTITKNKMVVNKVLSLNSTDDLFITALALCNEIEVKDINSNYFSKESINTDEAIMKYLLDNYDVRKIQSENLKIKEIPFSSKRKMASVIIRDKKTFQNLMFTKGGSDVILDKCSFFLENDKVKVLDSLKRKYFQDIIEDYSGKGFRVLAIGYKNTINDEKEDNLILLGLIMLFDPPKDFVYDAIIDCINHHITPVMITGDHLSTAKYIGKMVGIYNDNDLALTGSELKSYSDVDLLEIIENVKIYARVSPSDKIRIVTLLQKKGHSVAMIGDGVNDAPALKKADVGVSMGINGTDVSKEAAEVILMDDNYQTIVSAIKRGRKVYENIQNAILFLIAGNMAGIFLVLYTSFFNLPMPFAPVHLLFINLINDSLPAIAIGVDDKKNTKNELLYPRNINSPILSKRVIKRITVEGLLIALVTLVSYYIGLKTGSTYARTMVFVTITIARLFYSFNCRGRFSIFRMNKITSGKNKTLRFALILGLILVNMLLFIPFLHPIFAIAPLSIKNILIAYGLAIIPVFVIQIMFLVREKRFEIKNKQHFN